jgi:hypothetical protein
MLEVIDSDKHNGALSYDINYGRKKFCVTGSKLISLNERKSSQMKKIFLAEHLKFEENLVNLSIFVQS